MKLVMTEFCLSNVYLSNDLRCDSETAIITLFLNIFSLNPYINTFIINSKVMPVTLLQLNCYNVNKILHSSLP